MYVGPNQNYRNNQLGLTLIELMISIVIGALVLLGTVSLFQQSRLSSAQDERIARMQEAGRFALRHFSRELSMAGYWGGLLDLAGVSLNATAVAGTDCLGTGWIYDFDDSIEFSNDVSASPYTCISGAELKTGTDILAVKHLSDRPVLSVDDVGNVTGSVEADQAYFKTNGEAAVVYEYNSGIPQEGPAASGISTVLFDIFGYVPTITYVRPYSTVAGDGIPTLVRQALSEDDMVAEPLVEGVERFQIEFGVDSSDADLAADYYTANPSATEISDSVTARVFVLIRSVDPVAGYTNGKTYNLGSLTLTAPSDAYYRRVYSTTVQLKNSDKLKLLALN